MQPSRRRHRHGKAYGFVPDYFADSVAAIDFDELRRIGVRYIALDVDQTLTHNRAVVLDEALATFLNAKVTSGVLDGIFIASNSRRNLDDIAKVVSAQRVRATRLIRKPGRRYYNRLLQSAKCEPSEIAMIGDRLLTDVLGGNRAGLVTIMVSPHGPDMWIDRLTRLRSWEARYLKRHHLPRDEQNPR